MQVKDVSYGNTLRLKLQGSVYIRLNVSTQVVPRSDGMTVLANHATGKLRFVSKNTEAFM